MAKQLPELIPDPSRVTPDQLEVFIDLLAVKQDELLAAVKHALRNAASDHDCAQLVTNAVVYNALASQLGLLAQQLAVTRFYER